MLRLACLLVMIVLGACAAGDPSAEPGPDAGLAPDAAIPQPPSSAACAADQHACGDDCVSALPNEPSTGCALGCGTACPVPANAIATCAAAGTCDFRCPAGLAKVNGACVASACEDAGYTCGTLIDESGGAIACGSCEAGVGCGADHECVIGADSREDNDTLVLAKSLGDLDDAADPSMWIDDLTIDARADEDWFRFHITDGFDGGNPDASIELATRGTQLGWLTSAHELTVWFKCDTAEAGSTVRCGEWYSIEETNTLADPVLGRGCTVDAQYLVWATVSPSCSGIEDSGTLTFRVRKRTAPRGDRYDLSVAVE